MPVFLLKFPIHYAGGKAGPPPQLKNLKQTQDGSTAGQEDEPAVTENHECEPDFNSGEEDYMDSDFEGREGYRKGVCLEICTWVYLCTLAARPSVYASPCQHVSKLLVSEGCKNTIVS